jgi:protein-S-isoprenylcysteine O-methyltransferase Ste14
MLGLLLVFLWILSVAVVRGYAQFRRTGDIGIRIADPKGSAQWWSRRVSSVGFLFAIGAPLAELGGLAPFTYLSHLTIRTSGVALAAAGVVLTIISQSAMGASWRGDVDPEVRTNLVTTGPFRLIRNPTFTGTLLTATGLMLVVPNVLSIAMLVLFVVALEIQVRLAEEPYLLHVHGAAYRHYAARTGRFLPRLGRLKHPSCKSPE